MTVAFRLAAVACAIVKDPVPALAVIVPEIGWVVWKKVPVTASALWSLATVTGVLEAITFCPKVLIRVVNVESANLVLNVVSVAAPVGNGNVVALTG